MRGTEQIPSSPTPEHGGPSHTDRICVQEDSVVFYLIYSIRAVESQGDCNLRGKICAIFPPLSIKKFKDVNWTAYSFAQKRVNRNCQKDKGSSKCFYSDTVSDFFIKSTTQC